MEKLRPIPVAGLALISLKNETKAAERDLRDLISAAGADVAERARRERLLHRLESADKAHPLGVAKYSLQRAGASSEMDIKTMILPPLSYFYLPDSQSTTPVQDLQRCPPSRGT